MKLIIKKIHRRHAFEIMIYGLVGGGAWLVQTFIFIMAIRFAIFPSVAMILGNIGGMLIAYFGHVRYTFKRKHKFLKSEFIKFLTSSFIGLCFNVGAVRIITKFFQLDPHYAIIVTILTPILTFLMSKFWTFKNYS